MINWHRLFGQALIDLFTNTPYEIELEKDLSLKQQFLDNVYWGTDNYQFKSKVSTILNDLFKYYQLEGMSMSYTRVDYEREMTQRFLASLTPEQRLAGLPPEQRLAGLTADQIRFYLEKLEQSKH